MFVLSLVHKKVSRNTICINFECIFCVIINFMTKNNISFQVHAAYKRALLRFHPDRASKTDIRQQVEAEEKFKLISRMKEKFLLTTCH